ncbi:MAG: efflux RND transporter permease subunit, partial [Bacteroidota bacterium]
LVEGAVILPTHVAHSKALRADAKPNAVQRAFDRLMDLMRDKMYAPVLAWTMRNKFISFCISFAILMGSFGLVAGGFVKTTFFPIIPGDEVSITLQLPAGTPEAQTKQLLDDIAATAEEVGREVSLEAYGNNVKQAVERIEVQVGPTTYQGNITVALRPGVDLEPVTQAQMTQAIRKAVGPMDQAEVLSFGGRSFFGKPVSVSLTGSNIAELEAATQELKDELSLMPELADVVDNNQEGLREMNIELKEKARLLDLDLQDIVGQVRSAFFGTEAQRLQRGEDEVRVWLRYGEGERRSLADLNNMRIRVAGAEYPLSEIVDLSPQRGVIGINHVDGKREVKVEADISNVSVSVSDANAQITDVILPQVLDKYPGVSTVDGGQVRNQKKTGASLSLVMPIVFGLMFFVIAITFRSVLQALVLFLLIPFGFIGVIGGHWLMDKPMSLFSGLGIIALIGIIVNDGLVFVAKYNDNLRDGMNMMDALADAGRSRFRPILLTSVTTFAGLAPLLLNKSRQAQFLIPMAISVAFGLLAITFILLILLPALLVLLNRFRYNWEVAKNPTAELEYHQVEPAYKQQIFDLEEELELELDSA